LALFSIIKTSTGTAAGDAMTVQSLFTSSQLIATGAYRNYTTSLSTALGNDTLTGWGGPLNWVQFATITPTETLTITNSLNGGDGNDLLISGQRLSGLTPTLAQRYALKETLTGGLGNDTYRLYHTNVTIAESINSGTDTVVLTSTYLANAIALNRFSFTLSNLTNIERLTLQGTANFNATGNSLNNAIWGNMGQNLLYGGAGRDLIYGGTGNDRLYGGTDNDSLQGGDGADLLYGETGDDMMSGGAGDDTYTIDAVADCVNELTNMGADRIQSATVALDAARYANVEILQLTGSQDLDITGGNSAIWLLGNAGRNTLTTGGIGGESLFGGAGDDQIIAGTAFTRAELYGGSGNDCFYIYDQQLDHIHETANSGFDTVSSSTTSLDASKSLGGLNLNIETLLLLGTEQLTLTGGGDVRSLIGNLGRNTITGAEAAETILGGGEIDTLFGGGGDDTLIGGAENDEIYGGAGNDSFVFGLIATHGVDYLDDYQTGDQLDLHAAAAQFTPGAAIITSSADFYLSMPVTHYQIDFDADGSIDLAFISHNTIALADITAGFT
jgi:Ca2+-binding RTX toxin-like protein